MNHCQPYWKAHPDPTMSPITISIFTTLYFLIFVIGFLGNITVLVVTLKKRFLQSVQNIFLLNLAASDIMMCLLSIPLTPITLIMKEWYFGAISCKLVSFMQALGVFISTFSLCAIAIDRYIRLVLAPGRPLKRRQAVYATVCIWLLSTLVSLPYAYYIALRSYPGICGVFCIEVWPSESSKHIFTFVVLVLQFAIPLTVLAICYRLIFAFLAQRARCRIVTITKQTDFLNLLAAASHSNDEQLIHLSKQRQHLSRQKKRVTILLIVTVAIFGLTALPNNIVALLYDYDSDSTLLTINGHDFFYLLNLSTHCMMMACCVVNPVLYAFLNPDFRKSIMRQRLYANRTLQVARTFPS